MRLVNESGEQVGVLSTADALRMATEAGKDLVEVAPMERPPVCRLMDYGKWRYQQKQRRKQSHHVHESQLKELRLRPKTDVHDRQVKLEKARQFFARNDRVQFTMLFRGRERFHPERGMEIFEGIIQELADVAKVERAPRIDGRRMTMTFAPGPAKGSGGPRTPAPSS